ncbi:porin, partial [Accumulibacter sp.]|uniref:porin n=1 Tax=Accumulibacter sp. TaxID=2053492 RepID=UPI0028C3AA0D
MQKKLIALAVAGLASGAAFAQSNVTIYGIADAAYVYGSGGTPTGVSGNYKFSGIQSGYLSGSRLGFKGTEDLGNGLKAIFTLEYSLSVDGNTGVGSTGGLNARQQFVGLSSAKLGTVALGRQYAPGYIATVNNDPTGGATFGTQSILSNAGGNTITPNSAARFNNAATYTSPNFSGFTGKLIYGFGESGPTASTSDNGQWGAGGNYANGPLNIDLVYQSRQNVNGQFNTPGT